MPPWISASGDGTSDASCSSISRCATDAAASASRRSRNAMATWERLGRVDGRSFAENLAADPDVAARVEPALLQAAMRADTHLRHVDHVFERVFGCHASAAQAA